MTMVVNYLSHFLLTTLLLEILQASAPTRISNVSSDAHHNATTSISDPTAWASYRGFEAYAQSKLANVLFTYELARRLDGTGVTANAVHPGVVATNIGANSKLSRLFKQITNVTARSVEEGARTSIYLTTSPEVEGVTDKYFADCKPVESSPLSYGEAVAR
jgi:NAD(P)-dependent dehydrogenase (short-subunit alcohol dehydrogenase family)